METTETGIEISLLELAQLFLRRLWVMILAAVIAIGVFFLYERYLVVPQYSSTATLYVLRQQGENDSISSADFSLALNVVKDCDYMLKSATVLNEVKANLGLHEGYDHLAKGIKVENPGGTRILEVTVEAESPEMAKKLADEICEIGLTNINRAMGYSQIRLYEYAAENPHPSNAAALTTYILVGGAAAVLVYAVFLVLYLLDGSIKSDEDVQRYLGVSVLGEIPDANETGKGKYGYYKYYGKQYGKYYDARKK